MTRFYRKPALGILLIGLLTACSSGGGGSDSEGGGNQAVESPTTSAAENPVESSVASPIGNPLENPAGNLVGNSAENQGSSNGAVGVDSTTTLRVSSYNLGLLPRVVALTDQRVSPLAESLAAHDADVLCLQEAWRSQDAAAIRARISARYPFTEQVSPRQKLAQQLPVCTVEQLEPTIFCAAEKCLFSGEEIIECLAENCFAKVSELAEENPECAQAVFAQVGRSVFELIDIESELFSSSTRAGLFAFGGSAGLILASRYPLQNVQVLDFFDLSTTSRRAAIFATANINGVNHHFSCTHLTSNLEGILPYSGSHGSWQGEGAAQAERLLSFAASYAGGGAEYLAGDFNCSQGNAATGVQPEFASNCERFRRSGYRDDAADNLGCSFCSSNLLVSSSSLSSGMDVLLDHVFVRGAFGPTSRTSLLFDAPVIIEGATTHLSDHYGVLVEVAIP